MEVSKHHTKGIKNPLVLIALFAGVSEAAMAVTLVQLPEAIQSIFVWFVMVFPIILVLGFFFVLYKKPAVLFSPSDYKNDEMYLSSIGENIAASEQINKIEQLEESLKVIQVYIENANLDNEQQSSFAETWRQLEALHHMESNGLYMFLKNEIALSSKEISGILSKSTSPKELPALIVEISNNSWKAERMNGVLKLFPDVFSDYDVLKRVISNGV